MLEGILERWGHPKLGFLPTPILTLILSIPASMRSCSTSFRACAMLLVVDILCHRLRAQHRRILQKTRTLLHPSAVERLGRDPKACPPQD